MERTEYKVYKKIFDEFILHFNKMCQEHKLNYLIRLHTYYYETGAQTVEKKYKVKYKHKYRREESRWEVYAVPTSWFSFKKFPLIKVQIGDNLRLSGIAIDSQTTLEKTPQKLAQFLEQYTQKVRKINPNTFARM